MWSEIVYSICVGCFIAGLLLVGVLLFLSASSLSAANHEIDSDSDIDHEIDGTHIDHDIDSDVDSGLEHDFGSHIDHDIDSDVDSSIDHDFGSHIDHDIDSDVDSSIDHDFGSHIDHDIDSDVDSDIDHDFGSHIDHDIDSDVDSDIDHDIGTHSDHHLGESIGHTSNIFSSDLIESKGKTPLSLKFSLYLLWFGTFGTFLYDIIDLKVLWISITVILSIGFSNIVSRLWQKIARNSAYRIHLGNELLGRQATVKIPVTEEGGVISINTYDAVQTVAARSLYPLAYYYPGDQVYICRVKNQEYFVDDDPGKVELPKNYPRPTLNQRRRS